MGPAGDPSAPADGVDEAGELGEAGGDVLAVGGAQGQLALVDVGEQADPRPVDLVAPAAVDREVAGDGEHRTHPVIVPPPTDNDADRGRRVLDWDEWGRWGMLVPTHGERRPTAPTDLPAERGR